MCLRDHCSAHCPITANVNLACSEGRLNADALI